jgi:hypothetical protein
VIGWKVEFQPNKTTIKVGDHQSIKVILSELPENVVKNFTNGENDLIEFISDDVSLVEIDNDKRLRSMSKWTENDQKWSKNFTINGIFLGNYRMSSSVSKIKNCFEK